MKQFIYLDTDIVNSIIAQQEKGLVLNIVSEQEDSVGNDKIKKVSMSADGSASGRIWKIAQAQLDLGLTGEISQNDHSQNVLKEIASKTLHDAAFDIAYEYLSKKDMTPENADIGNYIELKKLFDFVDLEYFGSLFQKDGFIKYIKDSQKAEIDKQTTIQSNELNRDQKRNNQGNINSFVREMKSKSDKKNDELASIVQTIRQLIPYNRMLVSSDGYLIPLEDKYFRDNPKTMGFKHGGDITCIGYITNVIGESTDSSDYNIFSSIQVLVNQALVNLLSTKEKDLFVIHPIAIYYGE